MARRVRYGGREHVAASVRQTDDGPGESPRGGCARTADIREPATADRRRGLPGKYAGLLLEDRFEDRGLGPVFRVPAGVDRAVRGRRPSDGNAIITPVIVV